MLMPFIYPEAKKRTPEASLCDATQILREFVQDVETAYGELDGGVSIDDWPDLFATYQKAKSFLNGLK